MSASSTFVIVGAGMAGALTAQALREEGFEGRLMLVGSEPDRPYERPPLSKKYLMGEADRESVFVHPTHWYAEHDVELRTSTTVTSVDAGRREITLGESEHVGYHSLALATGAEPRRLQIPGADLEGVLYLRRLPDSEGLRDAFSRATHVVVIGGGWIGLETAAAARAAGVEVTLLERESLPLQQVLGTEMAQVFASLHRDNGVDVRGNVKVESLEGEAGHVSGVRLSSGDVVAADLVVVGVGIVPNVSLAEKAGLSVDNGVLVDESLRTSDPHIVALGDVANAFHPLLQRRLRVEHWANARRQPPVAARSMLGQSSVYDRIPYFFSDQYTLGMEYSGFVVPGEYDEVVVRGDVDALEFIAFWVSDRRVLAGMNVNIWDVNADVERLVASRRRVERKRLTDSQVPVSEL